MTENDVVTAPTDDVEKVQGIQEAMYPSEEKTPMENQVQEEPSASEEAEVKAEDKVAEAEEPKSEVEEPKKDEESAEGESEDAEYSLDWKEDGLLGETWAKDTESWAKENKLSKDLAQSLLDKQEEAVSHYIDKEAEKWNKQLDDWRDEVVADSHMGGDYLKETSENAKRVVERFGDEGVIEILRETGYGDNPHIVRFLSKIGKAMSDDSLVLDGKSETNNKPIEDYFYKPTN